MYMYILEILVILGFPRDLFYTLLIKKKQQPKNKQTKKKKEKTCQNLNSDQIWKLISACVRYECLNFLSIWKGLFFPKSKYMNEGEQTIAHWDNIPLGQ